MSLAKKKERKNTCIFNNYAYILNKIAIIDINS